MIYSKTKQKYQKKQRHCAEIVAENVSLHEWTNSRLKKHRALEARPKKYPILGTSQISFKKRHKNETREDP